jgi:hypothetical protein
MLLVQTYLQTHSFADLEKDHGVFASFDKTKRKASINYGQIEARDSDALACQCRGLVLTREDQQEFSDGIVGPTTAIAVPMWRFFNNGQGAASNLDWDSIRVQEKIDGTLIICYYCPINNKWEVATRSVPEADVPLDNGIFTFRSLFEKTLQDTLNVSFADFTSELDQNTTYCFELCTPYNEIVIKHNKSSITLLAARDLHTLQEIDITNLDVVVNRVQEYPIKTLDEIITYVSNMNGREHEGVVVVDKDFNRIKIKNINYVLAHKAKDRICNDRDFLNLIIHGKVDDMIPILPEEFVNRINILAEKYQEWHLNMVATFGMLRLLSPKKEFALALKNEAHSSIWSAPLFSMYDGRIKSIEEFLLNKSIGGEISNSTLDTVLGYLK